MSTHVRPRLSHVALKPLDSGELEHLDRAFARLETTLQRAAPTVPSTDNRRLTLRDPAGHAIRLDRDERFPTLTARPPDAPTPAVRPGRSIPLLRVWRAPTDCLARADVRWLADADWYDTGSGVVVPEKKTAADEWR